MTRSCATLALAAALFGCTSSTQTPVPTSSSPTATATLTVPAVSGSPAPTPIALTGDLAVGSHLPADFPAEIVLPLVEPPTSVAFNDQGYLVVWHSPSASGAADEESIVARLEGRGYARTANDQVFGKTYMRFASAEWNLWVWSASDYVECYAFPVSVSQ